MRSRWLAGPVCLAIVVTLADAIKPVLIDDTAYITYARHIADHPLDPYGFEMFWYTYPHPAMEVLAPPVVLYWLALCIRLFGDNPVFLKLWMFPFAWIFERSLESLLRRFARGTEAAALPLIVLSPAVLPSMNLMIDIPAAALGLAALAVFIRSADSRSAWLAVAAGVLTALAMQTKYTALLIPPLLLWYGLTHRALRLALLAVVVGVQCFADWEGLLLAKYGQSHFLFHLADQDPGADFFRAKYALLAPLAGHLGCLGIGIGLYAGRAIGIPRTVLAAVAVLWGAGAAAIAVLPFKDTILVQNHETEHINLALGSLVWRTSGAIVLLIAAGCCCMLLFRRRRRRPLRWSADSLFVVGWVLLEIAGYFALTPFPAARRVFGVTFALGVLAARTVSRSQRMPGRRPPHWVLAFGIAAGVLIAALDTFDAFPEKDLAERAAAATHAASSPDQRVWFIGHWGFQYYCERAGMVPAIPGQSVFEPGDWFVRPLYPDDGRFFFRPYAGGVELMPPDDSCELVEVFVWDDWLSATTIPNYYGGKEPVLGRDHPRLRVGIYRIVKEWHAVP